MEPFIGQIMMVGFNFAPRGWAKCEGQLLPIATYTALFSLLGTTYGGDGRTTFGLPDFRGRFPMSFGTGPGLPNYPIGQKAGRTEAQITVNNLPAHNHGTVVTNNLTVAGTSAGPNAANASGAVLAAGEIYNDGTPDLQMKAGSIGGDLAVATNNTGGNQPLSVENPYQTVNFVIALTGIFPSRS